MKPIDSEELLKWIDIESDGYPSSDYEKGGDRAFQMVIDKILSMQSKDADFTTEDLMKLEEYNPKPKKQEKGERTAKENFERELGFSLIGDNETISLKKNDIYRAMDYHVTHLSPNPKMTLEECKDKVAKKKGFKDWNDLMEDVEQYVEEFREINTEILNTHINEAMELYRNQ